MRSMGRNVPELAVRANKRTHVRGVLGRRLFPSRSRQREPGAKRTWMCRKGLLTRAVSLCLCAAGTAQKDESSGGISAPPNALWERDLAYAVLSLWA